MIWEIVPVNQIDLPGADPEGVRKGDRRVIGRLALIRSWLLLQTGVGTKRKSWKRSRQRFHLRKGDHQNPSALIFDSPFWQLSWGYPCIRVVDGQISKGMKSRCLAPVKLLGSPRLAFIILRVPVDQLRRPVRLAICRCDQNVRDTQVGDTVTGAEHPADHPLLVTAKATSMVSRSVSVENAAL